MSVVVLAGGTGGAKLARGLADVVDDLVVIANTADDIEIHGAHVSPDPDLVLFWLADRIDARGWGLEGDTFAAMDALRAAGEDVWFNLGDEDLRICRERLAAMRAGATLTSTLASLRESLGVRAPVLPMSDEPVRTFIDGTPFQEWMIRAGGKAGSLEIGRIETRGDGRPTDAVRAALADAEVVIIGPSNPVISVGPILQVVGELPRPVVAVSPFVRGEVLKGPTAACLRAAGVTPDLPGAVEYYGPRVDGWVADERVDGVPTLETDVLMGDAPARRRLAAEVLTFARGLA